MSEIDVQNAKQIRDSMDVLIEIELASDDVTLSYSGYSGSAKVADGELDEPTWPMRKLADLQGDGFPLDGSCVLYDSSTSPSQANGKLGVRGNVGEAVTITITGNKSIASLFIVAAGAESVTFEGTTTPIYNNVVTIPVGATSITVTLNPASETTRIEVSQIEAGAKFRITNENLIRATVSLRSDLSIIDPTLPESEINIEVYQDTDISEAVAAIPEDTPITYSAGYPGDMSPERKFYVTGQVTWADNVLTIQGVDAVHFLEQCEVSSSFIWLYDDQVWRIMQYLVYHAGIKLVHSDDRRYGNQDCIVVFEKSSFREIMANVMFLFKDRIRPQEPFIPCYVDAGRPSIYINAKETMWGINEDDCGDIKQHFDKKCRICNYTSKSVHCKTAQEVGSFTWVKESGAFINLDDYVYTFYPAFKNGSFEHGGFSTEGAYAVLPSNAWGDTNSQSYLSFGESSSSAGYALYNSTSQQGVFQDNYHESTVYTQVIPWDKYFRDGWFSSIYSQADFWREWVTRGNIKADLQQMDGVLWGKKCTFENYTIPVNISNNGAVYNINSSIVLGGGTIWGEDDLPPEDTSFPSDNIKTHFMQSPETCSFRWKGDPRMQPRDVFTWHRNHGTDEDWTLENITITHEGGGTYADITARKGVV